MKKRRSSVCKRGIMGRVATLLHNLRDKQWKDVNLDVICLFNKSFLETITKPGDEIFVNRFTWKNNNEKRKRKKEKQQ